MFLGGKYLPQCYFVCAVDRSRVEVPRTESNQQAYLAKKKQERKKVKAKKSKETIGRIYRKENSNLANLVDIIMARRHRFALGLKSGPSDSSERQRRRVRCAYQL